MEANTKDRMRSDRVSPRAARKFRATTRLLQSSKAAEEHYLSAARWAGRLLIHKTSHVGEMLRVDGRL